MDEFKIGKWNHDAAANAIDWRKFAADTVELMERNGKKYMLKDDLKKYSRFQQRCTCHRRSVPG